MDRYFYLALALCFVLLTVVIGVLRPDLRRNLAVLAALGAAWGPVSEYWFFRDYWRPLTIVPGAWLEDCLYGAGVAAVAGTVFKFVFGWRLAEREGRRRRWMLPLFVAVYLTAMTVGQGLLHVNSIYISMAVYLTVAAVALAIRPDLFLAALGSGVLMALIALAGYGLGLDVLVDGRRLLREMWLLDGTSQGTTILGFVPLTEVLWYGCWGLFLGVSFEFASGAGLTRVTHREWRRSDGASITDD